MGIYGEMTAVMIQRQMEVFGINRVIPALRLAGFDVDDEGNLPPVSSQDEQRLFRRVAIALTRNLGGLAMATTKTALTSYCMERHLPASKYLAEL